MRNKTDRADAEALLQALKDPRIKPVTVKSQEQQALNALHRVRSQWMGTRTARINALRGLLREFGVVLPAGTRRLPTLLAQVLEEARDRLPAALQSAVRALWSEIEDLSRRIEEMEEQMEQIAQANEHIRQLRQITGIGLLTATALYASIGDIGSFPSGRHLASWLGLTPREHSSGNTRRMGRISKQGDPYLRTGARSALLLAQRKSRTGKPLTYLEGWATKKAAEQHPNRAVSALANKMARTAWAVWHHHRSYDGNYALKAAV
jgi:transposase